jgi:nickel superoxide dismutase
MRLDMIGEHITTIEKSLKMIAELSKDEDQNVNQLVRWIGNKEKHAQEIQTIVYQYFMTQRIKPAAEEQADKHEKYVKELRLLHEMLIAAMKSKQSLDTQNVTKLRALLSDFRTSYLGEQAMKEHAH